MNTHLAAWIVTALYLTSHGAEAQTGTRRSRTVPGPYPKIIKLPRVPEAPDRPATGVLLYDSDVSGRDLVFFQVAHETGLRQLALAMLASERADSDQIKAVADTISGTQAAENKQLIRLASLKGLSLSTPVASDAGADFEGLKGVKFDKKWIERFVEVNTLAVSACEGGTQSTDLEIKSFAAAMLPLAKAKLQLAQRLAGKPTSGETR